MPRAPRSYTEITMDLITHTIQELNIIRTELEKDAQRRGVSVYELRNPDGSIPMLHISAALANLTLASVNLMTNGPRYPY